MKKILFLFLFFVLCSNAFSQVFETEIGKVEIIGLKKWQAKTLLDSVHRLYPNTPLHGCVGELKQDFGFAEVSSMAYPLGNRKYYNVVTIVEDNSQGKLQYLPELNDSLEILPEYSEFAGIVKSNPMFLSMIGIETYLLTKEGKADSALNFVKMMGVEPEKFFPFLDFLRNHKEKTDLDLALWILNNDANEINRKIALSILWNFTSQENVWWTVMNLQRDKNEWVSILAFETLFVMKNRPISVNWKPALPAIRHILAGTNLMAFTNTLEVLEKTKFPQNLAGELLKDNTDILIAYLHAEHELTRNTVINFIKYMSKNEKMTTVQECEEWVRKLN